MIFNTEKLPVTKGLQPIHSGAFWPDIDPTQVRDIMRLDQTIPDPRLMHALVEAIADVNQQLNIWRQSQQSQGYNSLVSVPDEAINGITNKTRRYTRAVYCYAAAELLSRYANYDSSGSGQDRAEAKLRQAHDYKAEGHAAIAAILDRPRVAAILI